MFDAIKRMFWSKDTKMLHAMVMANELRIMEMLTSELNKSADDSNCFKDWVPEEKKQYHTEVAKNIIHVMHTIMNADMSLHDILTWRYKEELEECGKVLNT